MIADVISNLLPGKLFENRGKLLLAFVFYPLNVTTGVFLMVPYTHKNQQTRDTYYSKEAH